MGQGRVCEKVPNNPSDRQLTRRLVVGFVDTDAQCRIREKTVHLIQRKRRSPQERVAPFWLRLKPSRGRSDYGR